MSLSLRVTRYKALPPSQPLNTTFDGRGGSIGRTPGNDWVLPDPEQYVSGKHAIIEHRDGAYFVIDTSTNGLYVNDADEPLGPNNPRQLTNRDRLTVGDYEVEVSLTVEGIEPTVEHASFIPGIQSHQLAPTVAGSPTTPPILSEFNGSESDHLPSEQAFFKPPRVLADDGVTASPSQSPEQIGATAIPADWDTESEPQPMPERAVVPIADTAPVVQSSDTGSEPVSDPVASFEEAANRTQALPRSNPASEPAPPAMEESEAIRAFLQGAGLSDLNIPQAEAPQFMRLVGEILREAVSGVMEVLMSRTRTKSEFRLEMTTIQPTGNNALKFSVSVDEALANMLAPRGDGHLPAVESVRQVFDDVKTHQIAVIAGMRAALEGIVERFDPQLLETQQRKHSAFDSMLPINRRAKNWDLYTETYQRVTTQVQEDFQQLFGDEFARAYDDQIDRVQWTNQQESKKKRQS